MTSIVDMVLRLHDALDRAELPHAFGGALALAWCTAQPRGTSDIDLNVFSPDAEARRVLEALPAEVRWTESDLELLERDGQVRVRWDTTPVDLFLSTTEFHAGAARRAVVQRLAGTSIPFLACGDLAVFKAFFNRLKDWADLEAMIQAGSVDVHWVLGVLADYLGGDDERIETFRQLLARRATGEPQGPLPGSWR